MESVILLLLLAAILQSPGKLVQHLKSLIVAISTVRKFVWNVSKINTQTEVPSLSLTVSLNYVYSCMVNFTHACQLYTNSHMLIFHKLRTLKPQRKSPQSRMQMVQLPPIYIYIYIVIVCMSWIWIPYFKCMFRIILKAHTWLSCSDKRTKFGSSIYMDGSLIYGFNS